MAFTDEERARLDKMQTDFSRTLAAIRADKRYSAEGKQAAIAKLYRETNVKLRAVADAASKAESERIETLRKRLFGAPGTDPTSIISYRDALDRAERATKPQELEALLDRAVRSGDTALQRACLDVVFHKAQADPLGRSQWAASLDRFRGVNETQDGDIEELARLTGMNRQSMGARVFDQARTAAPMPTELAQLSTPAIDRLGELRVPVLVGTGADDLADIRRLADRIADEAPQGQRLI